MSNSDENKLILKLLLLMAFADKIYREEEQKFIKSISQSLNIDETTLEETEKEIENLSDITKKCREIANKIKGKDDRNKTIELLSEMITKDKIVHNKEIFALQLIAEEWNMFIKGR
jgi:uncharacterized tellurite resistance protein B-like protein